MILRRLLLAAALLFVGPSAYAACTGTPGANQVCASPSGGAGPINPRALVNGDLPSSIDAAKIGGGSVSTSEFNLLNGITSFGQSIIDDANEAAFKATVNLEIGTDVQAFDSDLSTWAGVTPSSNGQSLVAAANYAAMQALLDLEAGTDFYSISAADAAFQAVDTDLTAIAGLTTTSFGRSILAFADPNADRILAFDDSAGTAGPIALADIAAEASPASGDFVLIYGAEGDLRKVDIDDLPSGSPGADSIGIDELDLIDGDVPVNGDCLTYDTGAGGTIEAITCPGAGGGISEVVEDTSPQLGGNLDLNSFAVGDADAADLTKLSEVTASSAELNILDGVTATASELNALDGITSTVTELNYTDGVTSAIQTQIDGKQASDADLTTYAGITPSANVQSILGGADYAAIAALQESANEAAIDTLANLTSVQGHTVTLTGAFVRSGAHSLTLTTTGTTNVTLPTSGTLADNDAATDSAAGLVELATTGEAEAGTDTSRAVTAAGLLAAASGQQTIYVPAGAMVSETTTGCADGTVETASNAVMYLTKDCDSATQEGVQFMVGMPKSWNEGTLTFRVDWTAASGSGNAIWLLSCLARSNDDAIDTAFGSEISVTDTLLTAGDVHQAPESSAVTPGGSAAEADNLWCRLQRDADNGSDTLNSVDARILGVRALYSTNAFTDD